MKTNAIKKPKMLPIAHIHTTTGLDIRLARSASGRQLEVSIQGGINMVPFTASIGRFDAIELAGELSQLAEEML